MRDESPELGFPHAGGSECADLCCSASIVTGAASGIGLAVARGIVGMGGTVFGVDIAEDGLARVETDLGDRFIPLRCDVTDERAVRETAEAVTGRDIRVGSLFNVAGGTRVGTVLDLNLEDWGFTFDLVLRSAVLFTQLVGRAMKATGGSIVNVSSLNARVPLYAGAAYASAKAAVEAFSRNSALELAPYGIRVNCVLPGLIDTPLTSAFMSTPSIRADFIDRIPMARPGSAAEIADACLFLASPRSSYITGSSLIVDGGWALTGYPDLSKHGL